MTYEYFKEPTLDIIVDREKEKYVGNKQVEVVATFAEEGGYRVIGYGPENIKVVFQGTVIKTIPGKWKILLLFENNDDRVEQRTYFINSKKCLCFCENPKKIIPMELSPMRQ